MSIAFKLKGIPTPGNKIKSPDTFNRRDFHAFLKKVDRIIKNEWPLHLTEEEAKKKGAEFSKGLSMAHIRNVSYWRGK